MIEEHSGQTWRCESLAQLGNKAGMWWAWAGGFLSIRAGGVTRDETGKGLVFLLGTVQFRILVGDAVSEGC